MLIIIAILFLMYEAFIFKCFWEWHIMDIFSIKSIDFIQSLGLIFFIHFIVIIFRKIPDDIKPKKVIEWEKVLYQIISFSLIFLLGYLTTIKIYF